MFMHMMPMLTQIRRQQVHHGITLYQRRK